MVIASVKLYHFPVAIFRLSPMNSHVIFNLHCWRVLKFSDMIWYSMLMSGISLTFRFYILFSKFWKGTIKDLSVNINENYSSTHFINELTHAPEKRTKTGR